MNPGAIAVVGAIALVACSSKSENQSGTETGDPTESIAPADQVEVLHSLVDSVTLAHFQQFETKSEEVSHLATAFCASMSSATLEDVRNAWWVARTPGKHAEISYNADSPDYVALVKGAAAMGYRFAARRGNVVQVETDVHGEVCWGKGRG